MKQFSFSLLLAAATLAGVSCNNTNDRPEDAKEAANQQNEAKFDDTKLEDDTEFATDAASGGMMEVALGKLALTNAASADVKKFGQMMVDDHTKAGDELKALAQQKNITLPATPSEKHQQHINELSQKTGADFDKAYMDLMVSDHKEDIDHYKEEGDKGKDADLKGWAAGKVSVLRHHLEMAQSTKDALK